MLTRLMTSSSWRHDRVAEGIQAIIRANVPLDQKKSGHFEGTPDRVARMYEEITKGYRDPDFEFTMFDRGKNDEMIVESGLPFYSLCAHHLIPFFGHAHVGYVPRKKIVGLSKLARTVEHFSRRFQVQEDLTQEVAEFLWNKLKPLGVAVVIEAQHLCMSMRGVQKPGHLTSTSSMLGVYRSKPEVRAEFFELMRRGGGTNV